MAWKGPQRPAAKDSPFRAVNEVGAAVITVGAPGTNTINVAVQLTDVNGNNLAVRGAVDCYLSDSANGSTLTGTVPTTNAVIGTNGMLITQVANIAWKAVSDASGRFDITINSTTHNWYLVICLPTGTIVVSAIIPIA